MVFKHTEEDDLIHYTYATGHEKMVIGPTATFFSGTKIAFSGKHFKTRRQKETLHSTACRAAPPSPNVPGANFYTATILYYSKIVDWFISFISTL